MCSWSERVYRTCPGRAHHYIEAARCPTAPNNGYHNPIYLSNKQLKTGTTIVCPVHHRLWYRLIDNGVPPNENNFAQEVATHVKFF
jgi:hypothetical protein